MDSNPVSRERYEELVTDERMPVKHRALWALLWEGELRYQDALSLDVRDVDLAAGTAWVEFPVRRDDGPLAAPLSGRAVELLREVIGDRREGPVFLAEAGGALSVDAAMEWARSVGVGIHGFRIGGAFDRAGSGG
ncbi:tyrosine-type recombinase/integrase [Streptomyces sp. NPDC087512]|uniref:tyrosine-type recombinase/integrase n=1 Tax=Streptomyces sp. NPDC087512 TaxID=3155059 RepID=UPI003429CDD2